MKTLLFLLSVVVVFPSISYGQSTGTIHWPEPGNQSGVLEANAYLGKFEVTLNRNQNTVTVPRNQIFLLTYVEVIAKGTAGAEGALEVRVESSLARRAKVWGHSFKFANGDAVKVSEDFPVSAALLPGQSLSFEDASSNADYQVRLVGNRVVF